MGVVAKQDDMVNHMMNSIVAYLRLFVTRHFSRLYFLVKKPDGCHQVSAIYSATIKVYCDLIELDGYSGNVLIVHNCHYAKSKFAQAIQSHLYSQYCPQALPNLFEHLCSGSCGWIGILPILRHNILAFRLPLPAQNLRS